MAHLQSSGKGLKKSRDYNNVDYLTLQRGHQYFTESYIAVSLYNYVARIT